MTSRVHLTGKPSHIASQWENTYKSLASSPHCDLVLLCAHNVKVSVHQAVLVPLSQLLKEILDPRDSIHDYAFLMLLDQESSIVRKMVELIYTGRSTATRVEFLSLQFLLGSLGICLDIGCFGDSSKENLYADNSVTNDDEPSESPVIVEPKMVIKKSYQITKAKWLKIDLPCPLCGVVLTSKVRLTKHMVDHYYEELENLFVGDFCQSTVCCKIDFAITGFGQYIRHKAKEHRAVQEVSSREVRELLDRDLGDVRKKLDGKGMEKEGTGERDMEKIETAAVIMDVVSNTSETDNEGDVIQEEPLKSHLRLKSFASQCAKSDNIIEKRTT
eukprot:GFUD01034811.1.p1 GENE.GFUD01034811.1~~GFUD01034811.1.p1  ORF type:complete len:330 (+),score=88.49 GFUD01034811.1:68-1057(+)